MAGLSIKKCAGGAIRGAQPFEDAVEWAYNDPFGHGLMGVTGENLADDFQYLREDMDKWEK